jgi:hypothetical protein
MITIEGAQKRKSLLSKENKMNMKLLLKAEIMKI